MKTMRDRGDGPDLNSLEAGQIRRKDNTENVSPVVCDVVRLQEPMLEDQPVDIEQQLQIVEADVVCPICLEEFENRTELRCGHSFCHACLQDHCEHAVKAREIPLTCPHHQHDSPVHIPHETIISLLVNPKKYTQLLRLKQSNGMLMECPACACLLRLPTSDSMELQCGACEEAFCRVHGSSHTGMTCDKFQTSEAARVSEQSEAVIRNYTKPCSRCGSRIQKAGGCDYVTCSACRGDICWGCGTHVHITGKGLIRRCDHCHGNGQVHFHRCRVCVCLCMPLLLPLLILYVMVAVAIAILTCCFCGLFCHDRGEGRMRLGTWRVIFVIGLPFFIFVDHFTHIRLPFLNEIFPHMIQNANEEIPILQQSGTTNDAKA